MRAAFFALFLSLWVGDAAAHAVLLDTSPSDGARLAAAPSEIVLRFNEPVSPIAARLIDSRGAARVIAPVARGDSVVVALPLDLAPGAYYLSWRVASADTHPIAGTLAFSTGESAAIAPRAAHIGDAIPGAAIVARAIRDIALALGVGGAAFLALVGSSRPRWVFGALAFAALAAFANLSFAGARVAEAPVWSSAAWDAGWASTAGSSAFAILAGIGFAALPGRLGPWIGLALVAAGTALTGHVATASPRWLFAPAQALHISAALFWLGAFAPLFVELRRDPRRAAAWGARFSPFGIAAVVALTAGGAILAAGHASGISTAYATLLAAKAVLLGALVFVATENRSVAVPALRKGAPGAARRFARYLRIEMALGLTVLTLAATLAHSPPRAGTIHAHGPRAELSLVAFRDGRMLAIERTGTRLELRLSDGAGTAVDAKELAIELAGGAIDALRRTPVRIGPGHYALDESALAMPGPWTLRAQALIDDFTAIAFEIELRGR